jgi:hypothetical protein
MFAKHIQHYYVQHLLEQKQAKILDQLKTPNMPFSGKLLLARQLCQTGQGQCLRK